MSEMFSDLCSHSRQNFFIITFPCTVAHVIIHHLSYYFPAFNSPQPLLHLKCSIFLRPCLADPLLLCSWAAFEPFPAVERLLCFPKCLGAMWVSKSQKTGSESVFSMTPIPLQLHMLYFIFSPPYSPAHSSLLHEMSRHLPAIWQSLSM